MSEGDIFEVEPGKWARVLGRGGDFEPPSDHFSGWARFAGNPEADWEWSDSYEGTDDASLYAIRTSAPKIPVTNGESDKPPAERWEVSEGMCLAVVVEGECHDLGEAVCVISMKSSTSEKDRERARRIARVPEIEFLLREFMKAGDWARVGELTKQAKAIFNPAEARNVLKRWKAEDKLLSYEQMDGRACICCGRGDRGMVPLGLETSVSSEVFRCDDPACDVPRDLAETWVLVTEGNPAFKARKEGA